MTNKVLLVGWESADWNLLLPMIDAGKLPNLARLVENGVVGKLVGHKPDGLAPGWTSMVTGRYACHHGIIADLEPLPNGAGTRPTTRLGRTAPALWDILQEVGKKSLVVGWPASHPAAPIEGTMVSDWFSRYRHAGNGRWPLIAGTLAPAGLAGDLAPLRIHPAELGPAELKSFVPDLEELDPADPFLRGLAIAVAQSTSIQAAACHLLVSRPWDLAAVYFSGIGRIKQHFVNFHPPKLDFVSDAGFARYNKVLETGYVLHDMMLGVLVEQAGGWAETENGLTVALVSERGFGSTDRRRPQDPNKPNARPMRYRVGILAMGGPGIQRDSLAFGNSILDVAPTLLHQLGVPVARDMDGGVLRQLFISPPDLQWVDSWDCAVKELESLGEDTDDNDAASAEGDEITAAIVEQLKWDREFNRAQSFVEARLEGRAIPILERAWDDDRFDSRYANKLIACYIAIKRPDLARVTLKQLVQKRLRQGPEALREWQALEARDPAELNVVEQARKAKFWKQSRTHFHSISNQKAMILYAEGDKDGALEVALRVDPGRIADPVGLLLLRGQLLTDTDRFEEAEAAYAAISEWDEVHLGAVLGLARLRHRQERWDEACDLAAQAVSLRYFNPQGHLQYASACFRLGRPEQAADALRVAIAQDPCMMGAYRRLIALYRGPLNDPGQALMYHAGLRHAHARLKAESLRRKETSDPV